MKQLVTIILLFMTSVIGFGQTITSPSPTSFIPNTSNQDASGFILSGFNSTDVLLTSISLINPPSGTTFNLTTLTGLTAASGFNFSGNKTRIVFTGTMANINMALAGLRINTNTTLGPIQISVAATVNPVGYYYNGVNGHFYKPITTSSERTTYVNARARSLLTTFKGQTGYLVTITSADEDAFIYNNVPVTNIWFAATDEVIDGTWVIDAGPEKGTVMKTSNGPTAGNISGVYNNWASGEPNGYNHGEDYAVTKWNGNKWNDLSNNWNNPYVIEYGTWSNPDDATFSDFIVSNVVCANGELPLSAKFIFDFGNGMDKTKISTKVKSSVDGINYSYTATTASTKLTQLGKVDITSQIDNQKVSNGTYLMSTSGGQVEWCIIYEYNNTTKSHMILVDNREFPSGSPTPQSVSHLKLFDLWDGEVTYVSQDAYWTHYLIYTDTPINFSNTSFSQYLRDMGGLFAAKAEFTFSNYEAYKPHQIELQPMSESDVQSLYDEVVTVSDVYIAFKELANGGIFGTDIGNEFISGIQFLNADVNGDGVFNDVDTYAMLQNLTGDKPLQTSNQLSSLIRLIDNTDYDNITKLNWNSKSYPIGTIYSFDLNKSIANTFNVNSAWIGDVNLSHSAAQPNNVSNSTLRTLSSKTSNGAIDGYIISELKDGNVKVDISLSMNSNQTKGIQFKINYDNIKLNFDKVDYNAGNNTTNFNTIRNGYINLGSIIYDDTNLLPNNISYTLYFKINADLKNSLGLISISNTTAVLSNGDEIKITIN